MPGNKVNGRMMYSVTNTALVPHAVHKHVGDRRRRAGCQYTKDHHLAHGTMQSVYCYCYI